MKTLKVLFFLLLSNLITINTFAEKVSQKTAETVARNFYLQQCSKEGLSATGEIRLFPLIIRGDFRNEPFYIFNADQNNGFIIISAFNEIRPVLGFSDSGNLPDDVDLLPPGFKGLIENFADQIDYAVANKIQADASTTKMWNELLSTPKKTDLQRAVSPLISTLWNQTCYYNELCPADAGAPTGYCSHVPVGCVAVAMGQVMKYWNSPAFGTGTHSYTWPPYGVLSAEFGNTNYNWSSMPNQLGSSDPDVATLLFHCGVGVNMQYGPTGSGSLVPAAKDALINFFGYSANALYLSKSSFSDSEWENKLRTDLDASKPFIYSGQSSASGLHAWVCDGYSGTNYFHFNWGWGGYANGYFYLSNINPAGFDFSSSQVAIMGIEPGEIVLDPPTNLQAVVDGSNVNLSWEAPVIPVETWLHWDDGVCSGAVGISGSSTLYVSARWYASDLASYSGKYITKVSFVPTDASSTYTLRLRKGTTGGTVLLDQTATNLNYGTWNTVVLTTPVLIDVTKDLWVGYKITNIPSGGAPAGVDAGPAVNNYGNRYSTNGITWSTLTNYNWNIQAFITDATDDKNEMIVPIETESSETLANAKPGFKEINPDIPRPQDNSRAIELLGYNAYRDNVLLNSSLIAGRSFIDTDVPTGSHDYAVTAVYNVGESDAAGPVTINIASEEQFYELTPGWNSISSYLDPDNPSISSMFDPIMSNLVILKNQTTAYYPDGGVYTLENWNRSSGYLIKVTNGCQLTISGSKDSNRSIALTAGWNLISVLSDCDVMTEAVFGGLSGSLQVIKEATGLGIYWPSQNINTLPYLRTGKAYFVRMQSSETLTYPDCE